MTTTTFRKSTARRTALLGAVAFVSLAAAVVLAQEPPQLEQFDADGDGALSLDELTAAVLDRHASIDTNGDGVVDEAEREAHAGPRREMMQQRVDEHFDRIDTDGDGSISREELAAAHAERGEHMHERMQEHLDRIDTNGDGAVSSDEAAAMAAQMLARHDTNGDGVLSADERPMHGPGMRGHSGPGGRGPGPGGRGSCELGEGPRGGAR